MDMQLYLQVNQFYQDYAAVVDAEQWDAWCEMFTDDCLYRVQSRENYDQGLPLAALSLDSKGMLKDRIYGITETIFHDPYYQRHLVSAPRILTVDNDLIQSEASYAVFRTKSDGVSQVFNVGRYIDRLRQTRDGLKLESRICVFDSEMILNSLIYPI
ncbi:aromatic-ring-hydroxylating dioxygenase subunit beta [Zobellella taiwanensis]|jgi:salicylate 5-hydroxylase small subunit|uniref:Salicylate hydroxylase n=1 Tax=Zobellella taiwanensis TaxID=347535 RepID=A0A2P7QIK8_9GAMM|nr:aromatic-ring-hydroxylating dioxygenase subunit beta [Zobellella taiwanensis]PSJ37805.1 salicylate hydroxylase [Zobellella taiwanensis]